jgi:two-component sensor histidine kinase
MTLNEFCSNATEFGALSVSAGQVGISWAIDEPALRLHFYPKNMRPSRCELRPDNVLGRV